MRAALTAAVVAAMSVGGLADAGTARETAVYPRAMAVLGDSGATGVASDPRHPIRDARANSWATGTNPAVRSIYRRILRVHSAIRAHNFNFAARGATVKDLPSQVRKSVTIKTKPELVLIQVIDNDVQCDGRDDDARFAEYRERVAAALKTLAAGLPNARIFVVGQWGTLDSYVRTLRRLTLVERLRHASRGPCSIFAPRTGVVVPEHVAYIRRMTNGYHAPFAAACAATPRSRYDGGAARRMIVTRADLAHRFEHLSIDGLAKLAAIEWRALHGR